MTSQMETNICIHYRPQLTFTGLFFMPESSLIGDEKVGVSNIYNDGADIYVKGNLQMVL